MIKRTLYFGNPSYLSLRNDQLVLKFPEVQNNDTVPDAFKQMQERTFPIEDLGVVILDHKQITITQALITALLANNCAVITCDERRMPAGLMLPLESNTLQEQRFTQQLEASVPLRKQLWQQTVAQKIANQAAVLQKNTETEIGNMLQWAKGVKSGDSENLEARAAAYYWKNLFPENPNFIRDREGTYPNNFLNYGYAILRAVVARALVGAGLLPTFGIHHHNRYNAYCLADDIMEPYRPYVDLKVLELMELFPTETEITKNIKAEILQIPTMEVHINGVRSPLMVAVSTSVTSLQKCYAGQAKKLIYPEI